MLAALNSFPFASRRRHSITKYRDNLLDSIFCIISISDYDRRKNSIEQFKEGVAPLRGDPVFTGEK